jgi:alpha-D-xyloside xylohydrolase
MFSAFCRYQSGERLQVHITDAESERYEVPQVLLPREGVDASPSVRKLGLFEKRGVVGSSHPLEFRYIAEPFGFAVVRRANGEVLFNTSAPSDGEGFNNMVFKDQYLEISSQLPYKSALYGLGESTRPDGLRLAHGRQYTLWATDIGSWNIDIDLYGTYPFVMDVRDGGKAHGVALMNSNGMDVDYNDDSITFKVIGGIFDFYFFAGPKPLDVVDQYTQLVGRPASMPYWVLGTLSLQLHSLFGCTSLVCLNAWFGDSFVWDGLWPCRFPSVTLWVQECGAAGDCDEEVQGSEDSG